MQLTFIVKCSKKSEKLPNYVYINDSAYTLQQGPSKDVKYSGYETNTVGWSQETKTNWFPDQLA